MMKNAMIYLNHIKQYILPSPLVTEHDPVLVEKLTQLEHRFRGAIHFLKKAKISAQHRAATLNTLPWFLVLGMKASGKTSMLAHSGIKYILNKKIKKEQLHVMPPTENFDWWVTTHSVLIDVPGHYLTKEKTARKLWHHFLTLVKRFRGKQALAGVVVTLSLPDLMNKSASKTCARHLRVTLHDLTRYFNAVPVYFSITKCDILPGFVEYFDDYGCDELTQAFGISMPTIKADQSLEEVFAKRFNALIKRLNEQLIVRLHHERNPLAKMYVKDFPLQIEQLKQALLDFLRQWPAESLNLKGVYLNSATQEIRETRNREAQPVVLSQAHDQALSILKTPVLPRQAYFIKQFLLHALAPVFIKPAPLAKEIKFSLLTAASVLVVVSLLYFSNFWSYDASEVRAPILMVEQQKMKNPQTLAMAALKINRTQSSKI